MADTATSQIEAWTAEAYDIGRLAAKAAATWVADDGNSDEDAIRSLLKGLEDGDPVAYDRLPIAPNLSGEWSGDPTPASLAEDITGIERFGSAEDVAIVDALADAFEQGVSDHFEQACEAELRRWLPSDDA